MRKVDTSTTIGAALTAAAPDARGNLVGSGSAETRHLGHGPAHVAHVLDLFEIVDAKSGHDQDGQARQTPGNAQLLHQSHLVILVPVFDDLAVGQAEDGYPGQDHRSTGWGYADQVALVRTLEGCPDDHLIRFGDDIISNFLVGA